MAQLIVRDLDASIVRALKFRAARHGRSAEQEHREILRQALLAPRRRRSLKALLLVMPDVGTDPDFVRERDPVRDVDL
jgi:plasmid stability protein